ncbi:hypothetical protein QVD17_20613 [Tagetes erecta]|uniref:Uncharacterized protein n=1 Tax=Tagetes erecta TaxID=13708 RepID=A0AAD8KLI6_TARER|nr:hypothetical protein QVD17_20613 [Tagetes erecta]
MRVLSGGESGDGGGESGGGESDDGGVMFGGGGQSSDGGVVFGGGGESGDDGVVFGGGGESGDDGVIFANVVRKLQTFSYSKNKQHLRVLSGMVKGSCPGFPGTIGGRV